MPVEEDFVCVDRVGRCTGQFCLGTFVARFSRCTFDPGTSVGDAGVRQVGDSLVVANWCGHGSTFDYIISEDAWREKNHNTGAVCTWTRKKKKSWISRNVEEFPCRVVYIGGDWERDFLFNDILPTAVPVILTEQNIELQIGDLIKDLALGLPVVFAFSSNLISAEDALRYAKKLNARVTIHMSDEWGAKPEYDELADFTRYYRQYAHPGYRKLECVQHIPLGYASGTLSSWCPDHVVRSSRRKTSWGFVGNSSKSDRVEMISKFRSIEHHDVRSSVPRHEVGECYAHTKLVPCGRGNRNIECFRMYEAMICGAIPVIVCPDGERELLESSQGSPPWLSFGDWDSAVNECRLILDDACKLDAIQRGITAWWAERVRRLKLDIQIYLRASNCLCRS